MTVRASLGQPEPRRGPIDLHLHTTVSDGRCTPRELVDRAAAAGLSVIAATDHDTTAGIPDVERFARARGIEVIPGIEITAIDAGADVHVLGYFIDAGDGPLQAFLARQRSIRIARVAAIGELLRALGMPVDLSGAIDDVGRDPSRTIGRPQIARAMVAAGYVADTTEAFDRWLGRGLPAFVPRAGATPEEVIATIHAAQGVASLAHPGRTGIDPRIRGLVGAGLDAIEVFHSDHTPGDVDRYGRMAREERCLVTGGSDFHGDGRVAAPGAATLPFDEWQALLAVRRRHARAS